MANLSAILFLLVASASSCSAKAGGAEAPQVSAAKGVLHRLIGRSADRFQLTLTDKKGDLDSFDLSASRGTIQIQGTSGVTLCRAAYTYLKQACHCVMTWDGDQLDLPRTLPDFPPTHVDCPNQYRHYFNVCTFGYTTAWWDAKRWQREIDWMAMHGINMPLAMTGQEKVWEQVWQAYGLRQEDSQGFFGGPAFLPWHRMGNVDTYGGPLPQDFIDRQSELQIKILAQERSLGMTPVTPAFSGFVPKEFQSVYPAANVGRSSGWCGFDPTYQLDARDPMFTAIQQRFIDAYRKMYGSDHLYLADLYNEMPPQVNPKTALADLHQIGIQVMKSILNSDPDAQWVMQGWLFYNDPFWKEPQTEAFLSGIPDNQMILLDLMGDQAEIWRKSPSFRKKKYIWNTLHNFGGQTQLFGDLDGIAKKSITALNDPTHGTFGGMGLTMEGTEQNAVVYELALDSMWVSKPIDVPTWIVDYYASRWNQTPEQAQVAANGFYDTFYHQPYEPGLTSYQLHPVAKDLPLKLADPANQMTLLRQMITLAQAEPKNPLVIRDLVDVAKAYGSNAAGTELNKYKEAQDGGDGYAASDARKKFETIVNDIDRLVNAVPTYRLQTWIDGAVGSVSQDVDQALLQENARAQVTFWGGPELEDYAAKEWSGLISNFYLARWDKFFDAYSAKGFDQTKFTSDLNKWERIWSKEPKLPKLQTGAVIAEVSKLINDAGR